MAQPNTFNWPLSGAVNQAFDFMNSWFRAVGSQVGLVNITVGSTADPALEQEILEDVGTYGRQLGRIGDALRVLIQHTDLHAIPEDQQKAIRAVLCQFDQIDKIKSDAIRR